MNNVLEVPIQVDFIPNVPKYMCVADAIVKAIRDERLECRQQLPSINELSEQYLLSRDTVEKAYRELRKRSIIVSVKGKGFFINRIDVDAPMRVLLIFNKISNYKKQIYNAIVNTLGDKAVVDLQIHHFNSHILHDIIANNIGGYDYYIVMPHFYEDAECAINALKQIPSEKLIILDKNLPQFNDNFATVYQDFEKDIYEILHTGIDLLYKYQRLVLIQPLLIPYPPEIMKGFRYFCRMNDFDYDIINEFDEHLDVQAGEAYVVIEEIDLVNLIKICQAKGLKIGKDVGIISYNETPLKEILLDGITVISTDHENMGRTAAKMILDKKSGRVKNPFSLIRRKSL